MSGGSQTPPTKGFQAARRGVGGEMTECWEPCAEFSPILLPRKVPENQEEEEERTELNQPEGPEAAESSAGGP